MGQSKDLAMLTNAALALLARREYSRAELATKLHRKSDNTTLIEQVLDALEEQGMQSDERFCQSFVRYRIGQGKGPIRIRQDLRSKQLSSTIIDQCLDEYTDDNPEYWQLLAEETYQRKFRDQPIIDDKDKAKRLRFLMSRGFPSNIVFDLVR